MKKLMVLFLAATLCIVPLSFFASADTTGLVVDVQMNADGSFSDSVSGQATTFNWNSTTKPKGIYGSFANKAGSITSYLQFGQDTDGNGEYEKYSSGNQNWIEIGNANMNNKQSTTFSFWAYAEDIFANGGVGHILVGYTKKLDETTSYANSKVNEEYKMWTTSTNALSFKSATSSTVTSSQKTVTATSWLKTWSHIVIIREYDATANSGNGGWTTKFYRNGSEVTTLATSVSGSLPDSTDFVYILGGRSAIKYSGIKLYNTAKDAATLYDAEKDLYEEYVETATIMSLTSPTSGGSLSKIQGNIVLTFNTIPNKDKLTGITLKKDGTAENKLGTPVVDIENYTVTLPYSGLESGAQYALAISGVESLGGLKMEDITLYYTVSASSNLLVDVQMNADGSFTNAIVDQETTFNWADTAKPLPTYGSFPNKTGSVTSYLQFGQDTNSDGVYEMRSSGGENWLEIGNANMNNQTSTTLSFWARMEDYLANMGHILVGYAPDAATYTNGSVTNEYKMWMHTANTLYLKASSATEGKITNTSWKDSWGHIVITRVYDAPANDGVGAWTTTLYRNGAKYASSTVSGALPDSTGYVYVLGGRAAVKYSGIKLYNSAMDPAVLYAAEKDLYEENPLIDLTFTNIDGTQISGFNGQQGSVTASFGLKNNGSAPQEVVLILALYDNGKLITCQPAAQDAIAVGETGDMSVTLNIPNNITYTSNHSIKLFVWEKFSSLQPLYQSVGLPFAANLPTPAERGIYVFESTQNAALNPATILSSAFTLKDQNQNTVDFQDTFYIIENNTLRLTAEEAELAPHTLLSDNSVLTTENTIADINTTVYPYFVKSAPTDSVTAISYRYFDGNTPIYDIENYSELRVLIQVANTSGTDYDNLSYYITINGDLSRVLYNGSLAIDRDSTKKLEYMLDTTLSEDEKLVVIFDCFK